jgi:hypothetical protein
MAEVYSAQALVDGLDGSILRGLRAFSSSSAAAVALPSSSAAAAALPSSTAAAAANTVNIATGTSAPTTAGTSATAANNNSNAGTSAEEGAAAVAEAAAAASASRRHALTALQVECRGWCSRAWAEEALQRGVRHLEAGEHKAALQVRDGRRE